MSDQWKIAFDKAERALSFESSKLAGYISCGVVQHVFQYAFKKGHDLGWVEGHNSARELFRKEAEK